MKRSPWVWLGSAPRSRSLLSSPIRQTLELPSIKYRNVINLIHGAYPPGNLQSRMRPLPFCDCFGGVKAECPIDHAISPWRHGSTWHEPGPRVVNRCDNLPGKVGVV